MTHKTFIKTENIMGYKNKLPQISKIYIIQRIIPDDNGIKLEINTDRQQQNL